jgi:hypothetical protein
MPIRFTLDLDFYNYITKDAVPIDIRAVRALQSSYALDLYLFFASTLPGLRSPDQMTWLELLEQLGYSKSHETIHSPPPPIRPAPSLPASLAAAFLAVLPERLAL